GDAVRAASPRAAGATRDVAPSRGARDGVAPRCRRGGGRRDRGRRRTARLASRAGPRQRRRGVTTATARLCNASNRMLQTGLQSERTKRRREFGMAVARERTQELVQTYRRHGTDTGSPEVQI